MGDVVIVVDLFSIQFATVLLDTGAYANSQCGLGGGKINAVLIGLRFLFRGELLALANLKENETAASKTISGFRIGIDFRAIASIACVYANTAYYRRSGKVDCCLRCSVSFAIGSQLRDTRLRF
jgi:hypothetical protein